MSIQGILDTSFENIGKLFSEKWRRSVTKSMVFRSYTFIKAEKQKGTTFDQSDMGRCRIASSKMIQSRIGEVAILTRLADVRKTF